MLTALVGTLCLSFFLFNTFGLHISPADLDPLDTLDEADFEEVFHELPAEDPDEERRRVEALLENEAIVKDTNEAYLAGNITWFDAVNQMSNLPEDEFEKTRTGALVPSYGQGLNHPPSEKRSDEESERFFDQFRFSLPDVPASYSSVDLGLVSPVKEQGGCNSCTAFASMAAVEVCFSKITGVVGDYSEQQLIDCAYDNENADGCRGAYIHAYFNWLTKPQAKMLANEQQYPYLGGSPKLSCPAQMPTYNQGAKVNSTYFTYFANEEMLKKMVYTHGAAVTTVKTGGPFHSYKGGIFAGCAPGNSTNGIDTTHAVLVVGYGTTPTGEAYWLIKNSWGSKWGENGFMRLKRGVGMCSIGQILSIITCSPAAGPTDPPMTTTPPPCVDNENNCSALQESCDQEVIAASCPKTCKKC